MQWSRKILRARHRTIPNARKRRFLTSETDPSIAMRILKLILMPVLMAGLMILAVTLFRQNNDRWTTLREVNAATHS